MEDVRGRYCIPPKKRSREGRRGAFLEGCFQAQLCAVAAYTYRSLMTEGISRELSDAFDRIAIDEMEHFRLLGSLIASLGGDPVIRTSVETESLEMEESNTRTLANALTEMINHAVLEEREEILRYRTAMRCTDDRIVRGFLSQLIADEERHITTLVRLL